MQFARLAVLAGCSVLAFAQAGFAAPTLIPMDEAVTTLASPASANPAIPAYQYNFSGNRVATLVTANPLLCGNTAAATGTNPTGVTPVYYSANGSVGASPLPFVFGAAAGSPTISAIAYGATNVVYNGSQVRFGGDPLDALVCYGLTTSDGVNFVHKVTHDLFADDFEVPGTSGILGNSTVALNVIQLPTAGNGNYYIYTIDVDIPPLPSGTNCTTLDCNFALIEGYDTSVFDTTSGQWCAAPAGATSCVSPPPSGGTAAAFGDVNINYSNYGATVSLMAPIGGTQHKTVHFVAFRKLATGVTALPVSGAPVVMAALFSPRDLEENKLDDNVATGNNTLANVAPGVVNDSTFTAFASAVAALQEDTDSSTLTFNISDSDSPESTGNLLHANATLYLPGGIQVPVVPNCGSATPQTTPPVNRTCTIDIPLNNGAFWNSSVGAAYQNQFSNVATDTTNGTYASGVSANIQIVATDAQGKNGAPVSTPVHIFNTKNDAPVITFDAGQMSSIQDPNDSNTYPTYSCSIGGTNCGATFNIVTLNNSVTTLPGPAGAFDELAAQTTAANNLQCAADGSATQVAFANAPVITAHSGSQTQYDIAFQFATPLAVSSSLCTLTMTDAESGGFPNSESAATAQSIFRIVVNL